MSQSFRSIASEAEAAATRATRALQTLSRIRLTINTQGSTRALAGLEQAAQKSQRAIQGVASGTVGRLNVTPALNDLRLLAAGATSTRSGVQQSLTGIRPQIVTAPFTRSLQGLSTASGAVSRALKADLGTFTPKLAAEGLVRPLADVERRADALGLSLRRIVPERVPTLPVGANVTALGRLATAAGRMAAALDHAFVVAVPRLDVRGLEVPLRSASTAAQRAGAVIREALANLRVTLDASPILTPLRRVETLARASSAAVRASFANLRVSLTVAPALTALGRVQQAATGAARDVRERLAGLRINVDVRPALAGLVALQRRAIIVGRAAALALGLLAPRIDLRAILAPLAQLGERAGASAKRVQQAFQALRPTLDLRAGQAALVSLQQRAVGVARSIRGALSGLRVQIDTASVARDITATVRRSQEGAREVSRAFASLRPTVDLSSLARLPALTARIRQTFQQIVPRLDLRGLSQSFATITTQAQTAARTVGAAMARLGSALSGRLQGRATLDLSGVTAPLASIGSLATRAAQTVQRALGSLRPQIDVGGVTGALTRLRGAAETAGTAARAALSRLSPKLDVQGFTTTLRALVEQARGAGQRIAASLAGARISVDAAPLTRLVAAGRQASAAFRALRLDFDTRGALASVQGLQRSASTVAASVARSFATLRARLDTTPATRALTALSSAAAATATGLRQRLSGIAISIDTGTAARALAGLGQAAQSVASRVRAGLAGLRATLDASAATRTLGTLGQQAVAAGQRIRAAVSGIVAKIDTRDLSKLPLIALGIGSAFAALHPHLDTAGLIEPLSRVQLLATSASALVGAVWQRVQPRLEASGILEPLKRIPQAARIAVQTAQAALGGLRPSINVANVVAGLGRIAGVAANAATGVQSAFQRVQRQFASFRGGLSVKTSVDQSGLQAGIAQASQRVITFKPRAEASIGIDTRPLQNGLTDAKQQLTGFERQFQRTAQKLAELKAPDLASRLQVRFPTATPQQIQQLTAMEAEIGRIGGAARNAKPSLTGLTQGIYDLASGGALGGIGALITQQLTRPLISLGRAAIDTILEFDGMKRSLGAVMGSAALARSEFAKLEKVAELPGLGLPEAVQASINLQAAGLSADKARAAIVAYGNAVARTGGPNQRVNFASVIEQLGQLQRTGKITAEDLKPMLRVIPELGGVMKRAFGTSNLEAIRDLGVTSDQFVAITTAGLLKLGQAADSPANAIENLRDKWSKALNALAPVLEPLIQQVTGGLAQMVDSATKAFTALPRGAQQGIVAFGAIAAAIGPAVVALGVLRAGAVLVRPVFASLAGLGPLLTGAILAPINLLSGAFSGLAVGARGAAGVIALAFRGLGPLIGTAFAAIAAGGRFLLVALVNPVGAARAAFAALGGVISGIGPFLAGLGATALRFFALLLNPVGLVRAGFALIATAIGAINVPLLAAIAVVGLLTAAFTTNFQGIRTTTLRVIGGIGRFIVGEFEQVRDWFAAHIPQFQQAGANIVEGLTTAWKVFAPRVTAILRPAWNIISGIVRGAITGILAVVDVVLDVLTGRWHDAWESIKKIGVTVWQVLVTVVRNGAALIASVLEPLFALLAKLPGRVGEAMAGVRDSLKNASKVKLDLDLSPLKAAPGEAKKTGKGIGDAFQSAKDVAGGWLKRLGLDAGGTFKGIGADGGKSAEDIAKQYAEAVSNVKRELLELQAPNLVAKLRAQFEFKISQGQAEVLARLTSAYDRQKDAVDAVKRAVDDLSGRLRDLGKSLLENVRDLPTGALRGQIEQFARHLQSRATNVQRQNELPLGTSAGPLPSLRPVAITESILKALPSANVLGLTGEAKQGLRALNDTLAALGVSGGRITSAKRNNTGIRSFHNTGEAVDIVTPGNMAAIAQQLQGSGFRAQFERKGQVNPNGSVASGDHIHVTLAAKAQEHLAKAMGGTADAQGRLVQTMSTAGLQLKARTTQDALLNDRELQVGAVLQSLIQRYSSSTRELAAMNAMTAEGRVNIELFGKEFLKANPSVAALIKTVAANEEAVRLGRLGEQVRDFGKQARLEFLSAKAGTDAERFALERLGVSLESLPQAFQVGIERAAAFSQQARSIQAVTDIQREFAATVADASPATRAAAIALRDYHTEFKNLLPDVQANIASQVRYESALARQQSVNSAIEALRGMRLEAAHATAATELQKRALDIIQQPLQEYAADVRKLGQDLVDLAVAQKQGPRLAEQFNQTLRKGTQRGLGGQILKDIFSLTDAFKGVNAEAGQSSNSLLRFIAGLQVAKFQQTSAAITTLKDSLRGIQESARTALPDLDAIKSAAAGLGDALLSGSEARLADALEPAGAALKVLTARFGEAHPLVVSFKTAMDQASKALETVSGARLNAFAQGLTSIREATKDAALDLQRFTAQAQIEQRISQTTAQVLTGLTTAHLKAGESIELVIEKSLQADPALRALREQAALTQIQFEYFGKQVPKAMQEFLTSAFGLEPVFKALAEGRLKVEDFTRVQEILKGATDSNTAVIRKAVDSNQELATSLRIASGGMTLLDKGADLAGSSVNRLDEAAKRAAQTLGDNWFKTEITQRVTAARNAMEAATGAASKQTLILRELGIEFGNLSAEQQKFATENVDKILRFDAIAKFAEETKAVFQNAFQDLYQNGFKGFFNNVVTGFNQMLARIAADYLASQVTKMIMRGLGLATDASGGGGGKGNKIGDAIGGLLGGLFGGTRAMGGPVTAGRAYLVGEHQPEVFIPRQSGTVMPTQQAAVGSGPQGNVYVTLNVSAQDAGSFRRSGVQVADEVGRQIQIARRRAGG